MPDSPAAIAAAFDLSKIDRAFFDDPFSTYAALRQHDPVHKCADGSYFLTRYADVMAIYRDRRFRSDKKAEFGPKFGDTPLYKHHTTSLVFNDPPLHARVRKLLAPAFTPRALAVLEPRFVALVDGRSQKLHYHLAAGRPAPLGRLLTTNGNCEGMARWRCTTSRQPQQKDTAE